MSVNAQTDSTDTIDLWEGLAEDERMGQEGDISLLADQVAVWSTQRLDLNKASQEELLQLPGVTPLMAMKLIQHRELYGPLGSLYELQVIPGFSMDLIAGFLPYVTLHTDRMGGKGPGSRPPSGPKFSEIYKGLEGEWLSRYVRRSTPGDSALFAKYAGKPWLGYSRLRVSYRNHLSLGLTLEKDPGESLKWKPSGRQFGPDFLSAHFAIHHFGRLQHLVLGDFTQTFGQGLVLSRGLGFGKGSNAVAGIKNTAPGTQAYTSATEQQFLRGASATYRIRKKWELSGFASSLRSSASLWQAASGPVLYAQIRSTGLHRSAGELEGRKVLRETALGGRLAYRSPTLTLGISTLFQRYSLPLRSPPNTYNQFDFQGKKNSLVSFDWDWVHNNLNLFGEIARSESGGWALVAGLLSSLHPKVDMAFLYRGFGRHFHSLRGYSFAERPSHLQHEQGVYWGLTLHLHPKWEVNAFLDLYQFRWNKFQADFPSQGFDYLFQVSYRPQRSTRIYWRLRFDHKEMNAGSTETGTFLNIQLPSKLLKSRLHFETQPHRNLKLRSRLELSLFQNGEGREKGFLLYQDLIWKWGFSTRLTARFALFDVSAYEARLYAYENDVLGFFSIPPYSGTGTRSYLILQFKPLSFLDCWLRIAQTRMYPDTRHLREIKAQIRLKF